MLHHFWDIPLLWLHVITLTPLNHRIILSKFYIFRWTICNFVFNFCWLDFSLYLLYHFWNIRIQTFTYNEKVSLIWGTVGQMFERILKPICNYNYTKILLTRTLFLAPFMRNSSSEFREACRRIDIWPSQVQGAQAQLNLNFTFCLLALVTALLMNYSTYVEIQSSV